MMLHRWFVCLVRGHDYEEVVTDRVWNCNRCHSMVADDSAIVADARSRHVTRLGDHYDSLVVDWDAYYRAKGR